MSLPLITAALLLRSLRLRFEKLKGTLVDLKAVLNDLKWRKVVFDVATRQWKLLKNNIGAIDYNVLAFRLKLLEPWNVWSCVCCFSTCFKSCQLSGMCFLFVTSAVWTVGKGLRNWNIWQILFTSISVANLVTEWTWVWTKSRVENQVILKSFRPLKAWTAILTFVLLLIAVYNLWNKPKTLKNNKQINEDSFNSPCASSKFASCWEICHRCYKYIAYCCGCPRAFSVSGGS